MNRNLFALATLAAFSCTSIPIATSLQPFVHESVDHKTIGNIEISVQNAAPTYTFDPKTVLTRLKTKVGDPFSQSTFDADLKTLAEEYDRIEPSVEIQNNEVYIRIKVWPRPTIRAITWEGNSRFKTKTLGKELGIESKETFNRSTFNKAFNKLKEYYIQNGYFESELEYTTHVDPKTNEIDIAIQIKEGRAGRIDEIEFEGFTDDEKSALLSMIHTKSYNLLWSWLTGTGTYQDEAMEQDRITIINLLQNEGYADAKVSIQIAEAKSTGKILIKIIADKGAVYHFGAVTFEGNTLFSNQEIEALFLARPNATFSPDKLRYTSEAIKDLYGRKGYIDASVQFETRLSEETSVYDIHFTIQEGEPFKIGLIHVMGNELTQTRVILRESLLIPGEIFDTLKLKATQERLEAIGYFECVNVYAVRTSDDDSLGEAYRDVYIEVKETTTGHANLFFGFSSAESIFGGLDLTETNFCAAGIPRIFNDGICSLRGGGEYAHAKLTVGQKQHSVLLSWMNPYWRDTLWRVGFDLTETYSGIQSKDYTISTLGGSVYASYPFNRYWSFGTKYRIRNAKVHASHGATAGEKEAASHDGLISAAGVSLSYDSTDSALKPHRGLRSLIETEFAGLGGEFTFLRFGYINSLYTPLWRRGTMKYRGDLKFIAPLANTDKPDDIPLSERFFLGGDASVRGYKAFDIGPHFSNGDPKGGISSCLLSMEYNHELFTFLDLFVFGDAGMISMNTFQFNKFNLSYGIGGRINIAGRLPVMVGIGFPVNPDSKGQVRRFFFSMGGQF